MKKVKMMKKYADLIAEVGIGANSNQDIVIFASVEMAQFVHYLTLSLYAHKVKNIEVSYSDPLLIKQKMLHTPIKRLSKVNPLDVEAMKSYTDRGMARIMLVGNDPNIYSSVGVEKVTAYNSALNKATFPYRQIYMNNELAWCIAAVPTKKWAERVFPKATPTQAQISLWEAIYKACRIDADNTPIESWKKHIATLNRNANALNKMKLKSLHYQSKNGTDLVIGLPNSYRFAAANAVQSRYNSEFVPNLPTEEVFASPHKDKVDGIVYSSKALSYNGNIIDKFFLKFEKGKVVDYGAEVGYDTLKSIIDFDEGSCRLGECALVPFHSPISEMNILFYNTLFDENASCHLALGASFAECVSNGEAMSVEELEEAGLNQSREHVDFMIGTEDLSIIGTDKNGKEIVIFKDGDFAI